MKSLLFPKESSKLLELSFQLHKELGCGFKEKVYQDAFEVLLQENDIPYEREKHLSMIFHGVQLEHDFYYDFLCYGVIGVEIKASYEIIGEYKSQLINYLHVGRHQLGLLVNFGSESLEYLWIPNNPNYQRKKT